MMRNVIFYFLCSFLFSSSVLQANSLNRAFQLQSSIDSSMDSNEGSNEEIIHANSAYQFDKTIDHRNNLKIAFWTSLPITFAGVTGVLLHHCRGQEHNFENVNTGTVRTSCLDSRAFKYATISGAVVGTLMMAATGFAWLGVHLNADPMAQFTVEGDVFTPATMRFDGSLSSDLGETGKIRRWIWDFGDGQTQTSESPIIDHAYSKSGDLTVTLTVEDDRGDTGSRSLVIHLKDGFPRPVFSCQISSLIHYAPAQISCDASASRAQTPGSVITSYEWDFGDGHGFQNRGESIKDYTLSLPGNYPIQLRVTDNHLVQKTETLNLAIPDGSPVARIDLEYSNSYHSAPLDLTFHGENSQVIYPGASLERFIWTLPNEAPFERFANMTQSFLRHYASPGSFQAKLKTIDSTGRSSEKTETFVLSSPNPIADLKYTLSNNGFAPTTLVLNPNDSRVNAANTQIVSYSWTSSIPELMGRVSYPPQGSQSVTLSQAGSYSLVLTVNDSQGRSAFQTINFNVKDGKPVANFSSSYDWFMSTCRISWINFDARSSRAPNGSIQTYRWYIDGRLEYTTSSPNWNEWFTKPLWGSRNLDITLEVMDSQGRLSQQYRSSIMISGNSCS